MHGIKGKLTLLPIALLATGMAAQAEDLVVNGFMSVAGGGSDNSSVTFSGYDQDVKFTPDAVLGVQLSKQLDDSVSLTGQLVSKGSSEFDTTVEWAFATLNVTDELDIRAGRLRVPFFYYSDFLDVGYAYNWIRPPTEVYRLGFSAVDGIDFTYRYNMGSWDSSAQFYYGEWNGALAINGTEVNFAMSNLTGLVYNLSNDWINLRASYHRADITAGVQVPTVQVNPVTGAGAVNGSAPALIINDEISEFYEVAAVFDMNDYQLITEWTALEHQGIALYDNQGWMVSAAKRMDDKTFHITYSAVEDSVETSKGQPDAPSEQSSITLGMRYDFAASTAFKAEVQYNDEEKVNGADGEDGMLYTVAIDMVF